MEWTGGYVADIGYTAHFYRETAPSHMAFAVHRPFAGPRTTTHADAQARFQQGALASRC
jgi:hypothetical protein